MGPVSQIDRQLMRWNFSAHADDYDSYAAVQQRVVGHLSARLAVQPAAEGVLLDIGTGTGALAAAIRHAAPDQPLVVMDIAHDMTCKALRKLPGVHACDGDARFLPFADASFARIVSSSVYQWVDDLPEAFAEVARILAPGGLFAVAMFGEGTLRELHDSHRRAVAVCRQSQPSHVQSFPTRKEIVAALQSSGLICQEHVNYQEVEYHAAVPDLLRRLKQIGASNASVARPKGLASRRVMQSMVAFYEESYRCAAGLPASYDVILALAEKPR